MCSKTLATYLEEMECKFCHSIMRLINVYAPGTRSEAPQYLCPKCGAEYLGWQGWKEPKEFPTLPPVPTPVVPVPVTVPEAVPEAKPLVKLWPWALAGLAILTLKKK